MCFIIPVLYPVSSFQQLGNVQNTDTVCNSMLFWIIHACVQTLTRGPFTSVCHSLC